ncbi:cytosolic factor, phosphatidylinositol/phosphatidylcholine transfer protein, partial [Quaeritorhiza haematococci]
MGQNSHTTTPHGHGHTHISPNQQELLDHFKSELEKDPHYKKDIHDDRLLLRFLRARRFKIPDAKKMFLDAEQWRDSFGVENIVQTFAFPEIVEVRGIYPRFYHKTDKMGRPVYIEQLKHMDAKKLWGITHPDRMMKHYVREYEKLLRYRFSACSAQTGTKIEQGCTILDLKGVQMHQFAQVNKIINQVSVIAQNYYPETLGKMFIINAPVLFTTVWAIVKGWLDENTVQKIS